MVEVVVGFTVVLVVVGLTVVVEVVVGFSVVVDVVVEVVGATVVLVVEVVVGLTVELVTGLQGLKPLIRRTYLGCKPHHPCTHQERLSDHQLVLDVNRQ